MTVSAHILDHQFMAAAIRLARHNLGNTAENPSVGALIVKDIDEKPTIIGSAMTAQGGRPHAEPQALLEAGLNAQGAAAYVTLEPCSHHGKTPPCVNSLIDAGIKKVVIALSDPDPRVSGRGIARLQEAGLEVIQGVASQEAYDGLAGFLTRITKKRPYITLKLAVSKDGYIGRINEANFSITGSLSQSRTHILRAESDAILIGSATALIDNPMLDCRLCGLQKRSPIRIVLDSHLQIAENSRLVQSTKISPLWIICNQNTDKHKQDVLTKLGCRIIAFGANIQTQLHEIMKFLGDEGINNLLVEGGQKIAQSFYDLGLIDKLILLKSNKKVVFNGYHAPIFLNLQKHYCLTTKINYENDVWCYWERR